MFLGSSLFITVLCFAGTSAMAQSTAKPTDPQIAHIAYTAGQIDIRAADLALKKTQNNAVKTFADEMVRDHTAVNQKALALLGKLKVKPEDNDTSKSLAGAAAKKRQELSKLSGAAFDKAYAQNEVAYHQTVNGALETTLIPSAKNGELKNLLETGLKLFQEHRKHDQRRASTLLRTIVEEQSRGLHSSPIVGLRPRNGATWRRLHWCPRRRSWHHA
jgi:putative membrane protein